MGFYFGLNIMLKKNFIFNLVMKAINTFIPSISKFKPLHL